MDPLLNELLRAGQGDDAEDEFQPESDAEDGDDLAIVRSREGP